MAEALGFPSVPWLNAVRAVFNNDDRYRGAGGGRCDCTAGLRIGTAVYVITFEGPACVSAEAVDEAALDAVDFYLDMSPEDWREMIANIAEHGAADLNHTLNTLDLARDDGIAASRHGDQFREDLFFRYNQTLQFFFDASARVRTRFA